MSDREHVNNVGAFMIGFVTIPEGERVAVWDRSGRHVLVAGPQRPFLFLKRVERLNRVVARTTQYLIIRYRDGRILHQRGPAMIWVDPFWLYVRARLRRRKQLEPEAV